jgi:hypothetical protein
MALNTLDDLIAKFEAIPEEEWCIDLFDNGKGQKCALGHLGLTNAVYETDEFNAAERILSSNGVPGACRLADVNNGQLGGRYTKTDGTPKSRVVEYLRLLRTPAGVEQARLRFLY